MEQTKESKTESHATTDATTDKDIKSKKERDLVLILCHNEYV